MTTLGHSSLTGVSLHLHALDQKGWISIAPGVARAITIRRRDADTLESNCALTAALIPAMRAKGFRLVRTF
jgi:SOS-response transcriptional repressor LexA